MHVHVHFVGICTHVNTEEGLTRVVLVDASFGRRMQTQAGPVPVPPHLAVLHIPPQFVAEIPTVLPGLTPAPPAYAGLSWTMQGITLEIEGGAGRLQKTGCYASLPSLKALAPQERFELNRSTVDEGQAAAVFLVNHGELDAFHHGEAVVGRLSVEVEEPARLRVTRLWDGAFATISLQQGRVDGKLEEPFIAIANTGVDDDKTIDFVLHYGVTTFTPVEPIEFPTVPMDCPGREIDHRMLDRTEFAWGVTHGCSNSIYP
jgi:hypothetical protein